MPFEAYLAEAESLAHRSEWVAGRVYVMAGGTERHDLAAGALYRRLADAADVDGCRAFTHNRLVRLGEAAYAPDVFTVCPSDVQPHVQYERDLTVVVEVTSPSSETTDRREKPAVYATASSFRVYAIVDPDRRRIEVARRDVEGHLRWDVFTSGHVIPELGDLDVEAFYDEIDARARALS